MDSGFQFNHCNNTNGSSKSLNSRIIDTFMSCFTDWSIPKVTLKDLPHNYLEDYDENQSHGLIIRSGMWIFALHHYIKVGIVLGEPGNLEFEMGNLNSSFTPASSGVCLSLERLHCLLHRKLPLPPSAI